MKINFRNEWVTFQRVKSQSPKNNRVLLFKPVGFIFVLLFPIFLYLDKSVELKSISGFVLLLLNLVLLILLVTDLISDTGKKVFNVTTFFYVVIFSFLFYYIGTKLFQIM